MTPTNRRFNVTVVPSGPVPGEGAGAAPPSPAPRHRAEHFATIPEDHALEGPQLPSVLLSHSANNSRAPTPEPNWDFDEAAHSDTVSF